MISRFKQENFRLLSIKLLVPVLIFIFYLPVHAGSEGPRLTRTERNILGSAQKAIAKKDYTGAEKVIEDFMRKDRENKHYLLEFTLGYAMTMAGKCKQALTHYQASVDLYPDYVLAWQNMGKVCFDLKQYERAGDCLLKVYELNEKKDPSTLYHASASYIMAKKEKKALPYLEQLISGKFGVPKTRWLEALLNVYVNLGLKERAFKVVHRLIKKDEDNPSYWKILAHLHLQQNDYKNGVKAFTIYSYLNPLKREETVLLGDLNQAIGIPVKAAQYYEQVFNLKEKTSSLDYEKLASAYLAAHKPKKAGDALARALKKKPSSRLWFMMGQVLYEEEKYEDAYHAFKKSAVLNKENGQCWFMMGYCALQMDKKEKAKAAFQKAARFPQQQKMARKMLKHVALWQTSLSR